MEKYDLIIIGGGPSGYAGAMRALDFKKKVLLIEKKRIGGAGVYDGVLTSKTLWEYSMKVNTIRETYPDYQVNFSDVAKVMREAIFERKTQMSVHLQLLESSTYEKLFYYEKGFGKLISKNEVEISKENGEKKIVWAENIMIATGSRPRYLSVLE